MYRSTQRRIERGGAERVRDKGKGRDRRRTARGGHPVGKSPGPGRVKDPGDDMVDWSTTGIDDVSEDNGPLNLLDWGPTSPTLSEIKSRKKTPKGRGLAESKGGTP